MYERIVADNHCRKNQTLNIGVIIFLVIIFIFFGRIIQVINNNRERGAFAYVQILNFSLPLIETKSYDAEDYAENNMSVKRICMEAIGIDNLNSLNIVGGEVSYYKKIFFKNTVTQSVISPFQISDNSIQKQTTEQESKPVTDQSLVKPLNNAVPEVLIYHTHTLEAYGGTNPDSSDPSTSVVGVGEALKTALESYGISVIHDTTNHCETYNGCYDRSRQTVLNYLKKYGDFKLIIDLHRDSGGTQETMATNINGDSVAKVMVVTTENSSRYQKNKELADYFVNKADQLYPGFCRGIFPYHHGLVAFNQDLSDGSMLIECGSDINSMQQTTNSAKYIARIIAEYINGKK